MQGPTLHTNMIETYMYIAVAATTTSLQVVVRAVSYHKNLVKALNEEASVTTGQLYTGPL